MNILYSSSHEETQKIGEDCALQVQPGEILCLYGDLGAGKTTFVQGLAKGLGIEKRITSPTFTILRTYECKVKSFAFSRPSTDGRISKFYHIDLYRLQGERDVESAGLLEVLADRDAIIAIEWPEKMGSLLPKKRRDIYFEQSGEHKRKIRYEASY